MTGRWLGCIGGHQRYSLDNRQLFFSKLQKKTTTTYWTSTYCRSTWLGGVFFCVFVVHSARPDGNGRCFWQNKDRNNTLPNTNIASETQWSEDEISFRGPVYFRGLLTQFHFANRLTSITFRDMDVSENSGTPKSSILIGFSIKNHPFCGTPIVGNTHMGSLKSINSGEANVPNLGGSVD